MPQTATTTRVLPLSRFFPIPVRDSPRFTKLAAKRESGNMALARFSGAWLTESVSV